MPAGSVVVISRPPAVAVDLCVAALLGALDLIVFADLSGSGGLPGGTVTVLYTAAGYLLLGWRRRFPGPVLAGMVAHSVGAWLLSPGYVPTLGVWLALYTLAARRGRLVALSGLAGAMVSAGFNVADVVAQQDRYPGVGDKTRALIVSSVAFTMFNLLVFGVGRWSAWTTRQRRLVADRAAAEATAAERGRVARDLHDIVAHAVTLMLLQAGGAARLLREDPERAETALRAVDELGQQAIVELRRMLGLLTSGADDEPEAPLRLAGLPQMISQAGRHDLRVTLATEGTPVDLDAGVDVSACRIVQEALTNAARYADPHHPVQVELHWHDESVDIAVRNHLRPGAGRRLSIGRGLIGMRERTHAVGGTFAAGPQDDGRFAVTVTLPAAGAPDEERDGARDDG